MKLEFPGAMSQRSAERVAATMLCAAVWLACAALPAAADGPDDPLYVGAVKCKTCHKKELIGNQFATWQANPHNRAFETLTTEASAAIAATLGLAVPAQEAPECLGCHATAHNLAEHQLANVEKPLVLEDGVQCESCHGPGSLYRKKKVMSDREEARLMGLWDSENERICLGCHNDQSPTYDATRYLLDDGATVGFDFTQGVERIVHPIPEHVKGRYLELAEKEKAARKAARE